MVRVPLLLVAITACAEPYPESRCGSCTTLFASIGVEVVHLDGQPAVGLDAKTVHLASGLIVHALNDNDSGFYTIADDNTEHVGPAGDVFRFIVLDGSSELATRDVELGTDECGCHIESPDPPQRIVLP
jgi:hypothetical protein